MTSLDHNVWSTYMRSEYRAQPWDPALTTYVVPYRSVSSEKQAFPTEFAKTREHLLGQPWREPAYNKESDKVNDNPRFRNHEVGESSMIDGSGARLCLQACEGLLLEIVKFLNLSVPEHQIASTDGNKETHFSRGIDSPSVLTDPIFVDIDLMSGITNHGSHAVKDQTSTPVPSSPISSKWQKTGLAVISEPMKIHILIDVIAEESDQVIVMTIADVFKVQKASATRKSRQLGGSMTPANFDKIMMLRD